MLSFRLTLLRIILLGVAVVFIGRLGALQLWQGAALRQASEQNYLRWVRVPAPRGRILDRQGRPLATNVPALAVWLVPGEVPHQRWPFLLRRLTALGVYPDAATATRALRAYRQSPSYVPLRVKGNLTIQDPLITRVEEELPFLPGVYVKVEPVRSYPGGSLACHLLGYQAEIDADELREHRTQGYRLGDRIGKTGVERACEAALRGNDGGEQYEVDALGRTVEVDAAGRRIAAPPKIAPRPGTDVTLTLDLGIQQAAEAAMRGHRGAVVALDPATGDILALVSTPAFNLNAPGAQRVEFNRAVRGCYPPGSVFKIITTAAALEDGKIHPDTIFYCDGEYHGIHCWDHQGHGALALSEALAHSCNVYFMRTAERVGPSELARMARRFGLGQRTEIDDVCTGMTGNVPDPTHRAWQLGETLQMGIGQSSLTVTPLQSAIIAAAIANGGRLVHPRLIARVGGVTRPGTAPTAIGLHPSTLQAIERGLRAVVDEGTAKQLDPTLHIAGKTGTAQNPGGLDHAWFAGYAPAEHPTIAVAVLIEHGGHGGVVAAPIAQAVIRAALTTSTPAGRGR